MKIVVVEDDLGYRYLIRTALEMGGFQVLEAHDVESAVAAVAELQPHAVLLDNWLPGQDGLEALSALRAACPGVTVIMHTLDEERAMRMESHPAGPDAFVEKGLAPAQLRSQVMAALRRHKESTGGEWEQGGIDLDRT